ncbi:uncharacterized protein LOC116111420 [Pistacia vera]|uniref:uncharacterized protein LOC116111420 n=1 Tax=Pistacia vera TaxID=55513 RepID=UPI001262C73A|nr:uncharacterized protein LOC116111420 [Pistacia vera]
MTVLFVFYTAREIWVDLEERLSQGNAPRVHQLRTEIVNTQQKDMSIAAYYTKLKGLWDEYNAYSQIPPCTCGSAKAIAVEKEKEKVHQFLMGLNEKYNVVRSQILNTDPLPSLARSYALVSQEEKQQQIATTRGATIVEAAAFAASKNNLKAVTRSNNGNRDTSKLYCEHCKKNKHTKETCFELHGYPDWWEKNKTKSTRGKMANQTQTMNTTGQSTGSPIGGLTKEQYTQLMSLLNLDKTQNLNPIANFAGPSHEEAD